MELAIKRKSERVISVLNEVQKVRCRGRGQDKLGQKQLSDKTQEIINGFGGANYVLSISSKEVSVLPSLRSGPAGEEPPNPLKKEPLFDYRPILKSTLLMQA